MAYLLSKKVTAVKPLKYWLFELLDQRPLGFSGIEAKKNSQSSAHMNLIVIYVILGGDYESAIS